MNSKGIDKERCDGASLPSAQASSSFISQASSSQQRGTIWWNQSPHTPPTTSGAPGGADPRIQPSNNHTTTALTVNIPSSTESAAVAARTSLQRIGVQCPDIALLDSELVAGEVCGDNRLQNACSWQSDYDADDYDKENQCVYRENIDNADGIYGLTHPESSELVLYPSPAFSEDSMYPANGSYHPVSAVPSY